MEREEFIQMLFDKFPEVREAIGRYSEGLLNVEMADFRQVVEKAMDAENLWKTELYLGFIDDCYAKAGPTLRNAIEVSFLEDFALGEFNDNRFNATKERMPKRLYEKMIESNKRWK